MAPLMQRLLGISLLASGCAVFSQGALASSEVAAWSQQQDRRRKHRRPYQLRGSSGWFRDLRHQDREPSW